MDKKKEYQLFSKCYRGREDFVAVQKNGSYEQIAGGLTYERFQEHIELVNTYALYQMDASGNVSFCLFDLQPHLYLSTTPRPIQRHNASTPVLQ